MAFAFFSVLDEMRGRGRKSRRPSGLDYLSAGGRGFIFSGECLFRKGEDGVVDFDVLLNGGNGESDILANDFHFRCEGVFHSV